MMRRHGMLAAAVAAAALLTAPAAQAGGKFTKEPTATGTGGAAASVDALATDTAYVTLLRQMAGQPLQVTILRVAR